MRIKVKLSSSCETLRPSGVVPTPAPITVNSQELLNNQVETFTPFYYALLLRPGLPICLHKDAR